MNVVGRFATGRRKVVMGIVLVLSVGLAGAIVDLPDPGITSTLTAISPDSASSQDGGDPGQSSAPTTDPETGSTTAAPSDPEDGTPTPADQDLTFAADETVNRTVLAQRVAADGTVTWERHVAATDEEAALLEADLAAREDVAEVVRDTAVHALGTTAVHPLGTTNDTYRSYQYGLDLLNVDRLPDSVATGSGAVVAILDSGVYAGHQDFASGTVLCAAGADYAGDSYSTGSTGCVDPHGHGTHVAGIVSAARNNALGVAGASSARILPVRVLDSGGSGTAYGVYQGIIWATNHGADVISMSLGGGYSSLYVDAINYAISQGVVVVAAAGNNRLDGNAPSYPGAVPGVVSVAATDDTSTSAWFSHSGSTNVISAPGVGILSLDNTQGSYIYMSGTSMATPFVSAILARYAEANPSETPEEVLATVKATALDLETPGFDNNTGYGMINTFRLLTGWSYGVPPPAPAGLTATGGASKVDLSWSAAPGATSYKVYRNGTLLATTTDLSHTDTAVTNETDYSYTVTAVGEWGESSPSAAATARPYSLIAPTVPTGVTATAGNATVWLTWTGAATRAYAPLTGYRVYRDGALLATVTEPAYTDSTAVNATGYTYTVSAYGTGGESTQSGQVTATPSTELAAATVPAGLAATAGDTAVTLVWVGVGSSEAAPLTGYKIYRDGTLLATTTSPSYTDTTVTNGTSYSYAVSAYGTAGETALSAAASATPAAPAATATLSATTVTANQMITLDVTGVQGGTAVTVTEAYTEMVPTQQQIARYELYRVAVWRIVWVPAKYGSKRVRQVYYVPKTTCKKRKGVRICATKQVRKTRTVKQSYVKSWKRIGRWTYETRARLVYDTVTVLVPTARTRTIGAYPAAADWTLTTTFSLADVAGTHTVTVSGIGLSRSFTVTQQ
ncbi:MAG: S8 family serine peptidase [Micromonosporaceae bacterium]|nr:S8 family serine peptidase [Micromonosporaceae bacterium]